MPRCFKIIIVYLMFKVRRIHYTTPSKAHNYATRNKPSARSRKSFAFDKVLNYDQCHAHISRRYTHILFLPYIRLSVHRYNMKLVCLFNQNLLIIATNKGKYGMPNFGSNGYMYFEINLPWLKQQVQR